jgi:acetyl esterase
MPVDPQVQPLLDLVNAPGMPRLHEGSPEAARELMASMRQPRAEDPDLDAVDDDEIAGVPVRRYRPRGADPAAVVVYLHGGGWVIGSVETHAAVAARLAVLSGWTVVSVDYRLAPEHPFPAAFDDAYAVVADLALDHPRIAVAGDSAGANLAAAVCLLAKDRRGPAITFQALVCPVVELSMSQPSYTENAEGYFLTRDAMRWFIDHYVPDEADRKDWRCAPLHADSLEDLPPALVLTAEYDPLRDEGEAYAERLRGAGVPVTVTRYEGMIHGFFSLEGVDRAAEAQQQVAAALREALDS